MYDYVLSHLTLGSSLDGISLMGIAVALLLVFAVARQYYVRFATPPAFQVQAWYPIPEDLPTGPVEPYGAPAIRAAYRGSMRTGVNGSLVFHLIVILAALLAAKLMEKPMPKDDGIVIDWDFRQHKIAPPPPLDESSRQGAEKFVPGPPPPPVGRIPIPVPETRASLLATIATMKEEDLGVFDPNATEYSIFGKGTGPMPDGPGGRGFEGEQEDAPISSKIVEQMPVLVTIPEPDYPEMARSSLTEGRVLLRVLVGKDGHVREVKVAESIPGLDESAMKAALQAVFRPALWQNKPVSVWVSMPIRFNLREP